MAVFSLAAGATLTIWLRDPFPDWIYECCTCGLGILVCSKRVFGRGAGGRRGNGLGADAAGSSGWLAALVALIGVWGWGQLTAGATVYRWATVNASLRMMALAATGVTAWFVIGSTHVREAFLRGLAWFGFLISVVSVLAYFTSPSQVMWLFAAPYPDVWGPFLSRNNFAQFLELALPVTLALGLAAGGKPDPAGGKTYVGMAAVMVAAGLAAASRAGAVLLLLEAAAVFWLSGRERAGAGFRRTLAGFVVAAAVLGLVGGAGTLWTRLKQPDPLEYRREIYRSAVAMLRAHAGKGTGLGTFPVVYPAYAGFDSGAVVEHAHSDWLEWADEGGIPYAAVWGALALSLVRPAIRSIWGIGVLAVFLHALVDYPFARFGVAAWVFILAGAVTRAAGERTQALKALTKRRRA